METVYCGACKTPLPERVPAAIKLDNVLAKLRFYVRVCPNCGCQRYEHEDLTPPTL